MPISSETKQQLFETLKQTVLKHCPPLVNNKNTETAFEVIGNTPTPYGSKKVIVPGMYFSSAVIRKDSVVFYFFPTYMNENEFKDLAPKAWKCLKGKTCFHFKKLEDLDVKEINALMKKGVAAYKRMGWIK
jgi:hypothetical protein